MINRGLFASLLKLGNKTRQQKTCDRGGIAKSWAFRNSLGKVNGLIFTLLAMLLSADLAIAIDIGEPTFVGTTIRKAGPKPAHQKMAITYMTAVQMQSTVVSLTGFFHPAFDAYGNVLGAIDPISGARTTDRPSFISVLVMQKISESVADAVLARELFLDDHERVVFRGIDLQITPSSAAIEAFAGALFERWLGMPIDALSQSTLVSRFNQGQYPAEGYGKILEFLLQHGGLYYY